MDLGDLFGLVKHLDPRRKRREEVVPPPVVMRMPGEGEGVALDAAVRPRTVTPPDAVAPAVLTTQNVPVVAPDLHPAVDAPPLPQKQIGLIGTDVDPRTAGMGTRPRVALPMEYRANRVAEISAEPEAKDENGRLASAAKAGALGLLSLNPFVALQRFGQGLADPAWDERRDQNQALAREQGALGRIVAARKASADVVGDELSNEYKAAQIPMLLEKPELEWAKVANKQAFDAWRMSSGDRKADTAEEYIAWRMANGDRRATTAEGLAELRAEYVREIQPKQFERRQTEVERNNRVNNALGGERNDQGWARVEQGERGLTLRERIATGNLDAAWARIGQGYDRLDEGRRKQIDELAAKAAKAEAEAAYFAGQSGKESEAKLKRQEAENLRLQAEAVHNRGGFSRPAPRVARPEPSRPAGPPISEEDFVSQARQRMGGAFNETKARAAYRARYGR
jgi:hypothetical protein